MRNIRISLFLITLVLICIGVVMIYSASSIYAWERLGDANYYLKRQILYLFIGFTLVFLVMLFDYRQLQRYAKPLFFISLALLISVLIFGREVGGAKRWFRLFGFSFQPSELMQVSIIVYLADFIARKKKTMKHFWSGFFPPVLMLGLVCVLLLSQPDLGSAVSIVAVTFIMLFASGVKISYLLTCCLSAVPVLYFLIFKVPYRRMRILTFINPWMDPKGSGFQIIQSQIALGSGGIFGLGIGQGKQKLFYLPAAHTDFIFSIIGEEAGLIGAFLVIILFILFIWQAALICRKTHDAFGRFLCLGIISMIALKACINIGVSTGFMPTKGLPLPFISYGGTSLVFDMISVGILLNVSRSNEGAGY
ncbi:MAG: stage V sporulation protein E [Candidatus Omnitrophica bacterium CG11_big_fil_rev_8_21_14_0_20_42_13]|uniref:Probable peptidoglycan glycosyltransferase FtsW n=1 Tax=Candidatus Ghiorseimicrobium undicola TaxID=1974746 RepID=A0A2H0LV26_9BACT|nr:MAG: stage V sporulation protein E [Candidatus Omnitrophica bacterium CG11_big_fil_rev_8_21_14_0_20_42_13]